MSFDHEWMERRELMEPGLVTDEVSTGMDVPLGVWTAYDSWYWTGTATYQPWKDVASFFNKKDNSNDL